jgi:hypothetical protein
MRHAPKQHDGDVPFPRFELPQIPFGNIRLARERFAGHAAALAQLAQATADPVQKSLIRKSRAFLSHGRGEVPGRSRRLHLL